MDTWKKNDVVGFLFFLSILIGVLITWYRICFKGGDQRWSDSLVSYHKKFGMDLDGFDLFKPVVLRVAITIVLIAFIILSYLITRTESFLYNWNQLWN